MTTPDTTPLEEWPDPHADATHRPCCSAHGVPMTCARYRRTHFVEVRPCCQADRQALMDEIDEALSDVPEPEEEAPELSAAEKRQLGQPEAEESLRMRVAARLFKEDGGEPIGHPVLDGAVQQRYLRLADAALDVVLTDARR